MLYGVVLAVHVGLALFLIVIILLQGGRGGLGETLGGAAAQSLFGGGANTVMTKLTAIFASLFMVTSLSLAALSTAHGRSVIDRMPAEPPLPITLPQAPEAGAPRPAAPPAPATTPAAPGTAPAESAQ